MLEAGPQLTVSERFTRAEGDDPRWMHPEPTVFDPKTWVHPEQSEFYVKCAQAAQKRQ
jgi:hypothetical protein